jgi:hypothetical protein
MNRPNQLSLLKEKGARDPQKGKATRKAGGGNPNGIPHGRIGAPPPVLLSHNTAHGPHHQRERVKERILEKLQLIRDLTLEHYGVIFTKSTVTQPIGVLIILIELEVHLLVLRDPGAQHVTVLAIPLTHAMPLPFVSLAKERAPPKEAREITATVLGKAKTSPQRTTPTTPLRLCMMPHLPPRIKIGGLNKSWDPLSWTTIIMLMH